MRTILNASIVMVGCILPGLVLAQDNCLVSLNVNVSRSVTFLAFGPNAGDTLTKTMACPLAEGLRSELFLSGQALDPNLLADANQLRTRIAQMRAELATDKTELQSATTRARREIVLQTVKIMLGGTGVVAASTGCVTSGSTCIVALGGIAALYELIQSMANTGGDLAQQATQARAEIDKILPVLQAAQTQLNDSLARQGRLRYNVAFNEMCRAIRQQCM